MKRDSGIWVFLIIIFCWNLETLKGSSTTSTQPMPLPKTAGSSSDRKSFLEWDDMMVDWSRLNSTSNSRVIVVDKNGHGDSITVQGAVDMVPDGNFIRHKIYIRPGIYSEKVYVPKSKPYISFIGDEDKAEETVITWHDKASDRRPDGTKIGTYQSASVTIESDYFCARHVTFQNTIVSIPESHDMQAVALRMSGTKAWLHKVRILGTQDTLLDESGLHFFDQCFIQGTVDFICGNAKSFFQKCTLNSVATGIGAVAAHRRQSADEDTGFSFVNCYVTGTGKIYLGRAWGNYSRIIYSYSNFDGVVNPIGWDDWNTPDKDRTVEFGEFQCRGEGANRDHRAAYSRSYNFLEAEYSLTTEFIYGRAWLDPFTTTRFVNGRW